MALPVPVRVPDVFDAVLLDIIRRNPHLWPTKAVRRFLARLADNNGKDA
jgi:hypothetical protein